MTSQLPSQAPSRLGEWLDRQTSRLMILPAVLILLALSIFPMIVSAYLALSKFSLAPGGYELRYVGFRNFKKLLFGSQQFHFLGTLGGLSIFAWLILAGLLEGDAGPNNYGFRPNAPSRST